MKTAQDKDPIRGFRMPDRLYEAVQRYAQREDLTASQVVRRALAQYVGTDYRSEDGSE